MPLQKMLIVVMFSASLLGIGLSLHYRSRLEACNVQRRTVTNRTITLIRQINVLAKDIRIATYPTDCDVQTQKVIGKECDLGSYMEWAGPELERETGALLILSTDP